MFPISLRARLLNTLCGLLAAIPVAVAERGIAGHYISIPDRIVAAPDLQADVERGLFFVLENRKDPKSRVIAVHFLRFPARHAQKGRAPVFLLPGGPGYEANFRNPHGIYSLRMVERLRRTRDVIYLSQRGNPLAPGLVADLRLKQIASPLNEAGSAVRHRERLRASLREAVQRWAGRGVDLRGYDILNIVDDVYELRAALGYEKIVLRGCSFGSQWSLSYLKRWPQTVDRAFLSGVEPLDYTYDSPQWLWVSLTRLARRAESYPALAKDLPPGGLMAALQTVIERLARQPQTVQIQDPGNGQPVAVMLGVDDVRELLVSGGLLRPTREATRDERVANWPRFVLEMHRGDFRYAAARTWASRRVEGSGEPLIGLLIDNSLGITSQREARLLAAPEARWLGDINSSYRDTRDLTPTPRVDDQFRADWPIDVPVLLLNGDLDWATPVENARHLRGELKHGHLVEVKGGTHCDESRMMTEQQPEQMERIDAFIDADFEQSTPEAFFATLPSSVAYPPIDFAPLSGPSLYEQWLTAYRP